MNKACLMVFAKAPVPGKAKNRLARKYGARGAARLYRQMMLYQLSQLSGLQDTDILLFCSPHTRHPFFQQCRRLFGLRLVRQRGCDLGERMFYAFRWSKHRYQQSVLIGSDIPEMDMHLLDALLREKTSAKVVSCIPAHDGGYVLIGAQAEHAAIFRNIPWGTSSVMSKTRIRARQRGLQCIEYNECQDVDTPGDIRRIRRKGLIRGYP